jgi:hypothetical protein
MNNGAEIVDNFLHTLKILIKEINIIVPDNPNSYRINKRICLAIQYDPLFVFKKVGENLYNYQKFVYDEESDDLLLQWDFKETKTIKDPDLEDIVVLVISVLKERLQKMSKEERKRIRSMISELLDYYVEYVYITS